MRVASHEVLVDRLHARRALGIDEPVSTAQLCGRQSIRALGRRRLSGVLSSVARRYQRRPTRVRMAAQRSVVGRQSSTISPSDRASVVHREPREHVGQEEGEPNVSPLPSMPTRFSPSFQSPPDQRESVLAEAKRPWRMARTQCSW
jgi:hypothetical protein